MDKMFTEDITARIKSDFSARREAKRALESQWSLNENFLVGNQYCRVGVSGEVEDEEKDYFWQEREVYNHLASIVETRLAKLQRVRPSMSVRPFSSDDGDVKTSKVATKILSAAASRLDLSQLLSKGAMWSELTGSVFYKVIWETDSGLKVGQLKGKDVYEGDVKIEVCPPHEIFPDDIGCQDLSACASIMHARAMPVKEIESRWGIKTEAEDVDEYVTDACFTSGGLGSPAFAQRINRFKRNACALVIESYTMPCKEFPRGELAIVSGANLLYYGDLPYLNGSDFKRALPFVKQECLTRAGCFFGQSVLERAIPIQRSYNAVKNRKHEFLNRIAMGVLAVEDGSVDMENLSCEGLSPGKIIVYRQGANPPRFMDPGHVPSDFASEEDRLLNEFISVSGVSEIMRSSSIPSSLTSGVALQLLIEQDDTRLSVTAELIRNAVKEIGRMILRLYKQFAFGVRLMRVAGNGGEAEVISFSGSDIGCDDIVMDTDNELSTTPATKQNMMFELLRTGLLSGADGKLSEDTKYKILDTLGFGGWEAVKDASEMHVKRADKENMAMKTQQAEVCEIDDHTAHIRRHSEYLLENGFAGKKSETVKKRLLEHIRQHKKFAAAEGGEDENEKQG